MQGVRCLATISPDHFYCPLAFSDCTEFYFAGSILMGSNTAMTLSDTARLAQQLVQIPSVTPQDGGCQALLAARLHALGFECETLPYHDVTNLWARRGSGTPLLVFAGHTDVVPVGPPEQWRWPPFAGVIDGGFLHGRGAADMKGSIACFVTACERFLHRHPDHRGRIGLLITSDEEGTARWGTRAVMQTLSERGETIDMCIVGEPSSEEKLGDVVKIGRRGSLNGSLKIIGKQGHIAYPQQADNPIHRALAALDQITAIRWDQGDAQFQPSSLGFSNLTAGTGAANVIPGHLEARFNIRFSPATTAASIRQQVESVLRRHRLRFELDWHLSGEPFITQPGQLVESVRQAIQQTVGYAPRLSTAGGTSDGRFIAPTGAQVVELGPINATIHQIDEQVSVPDLETLSLCYQHILEKILR